MSVLAGVKVFADLCIWFAAVAATGWWQGEIPALLLAPALCALGAGVGCAGQGKAVRFLGLAPACLSLCFAGGSGLRAAILAAAILYVALVLLQNRFALEHGVYSGYFLRGLIPLGALLLFSLLGDSWRGVLFYGGLYALAGVFLLRQLRLTDCLSWRAQLLNLAALLAVAAGGGVLLVLVLAASELGFILRWIWQEAVLLVGALLWGAVWLLSWLWSWAAYLLALLRIGGEEREIPAGGEPAVNLEPYFGETAHDPTVFYILLAAVMVLAAVWFARRGLAQMGGERRSVGGKVTLERIIGDSARPSRAAPGSGRGRVRQSYRRFLRLMRKRGAELSPAQTTEEIHRAVRHLAEEKAAYRLRGLYLSARYDENAAITPRQVREARELVRQLERERQK